MSGGFGCVKTPVAPTTNRAVTSSPSAVVSSQRWRSSSHSAATTFVWKRIRERSPYLSTQCSA